MQAKSVRRSRIVIVAVIWWMLSGCGTPIFGGGAPSSSLNVQYFVRQHTACERAQYHSVEWSPDGSQIYYAISVGGKDDIRVMRSNPGESGQDDRLLVENAFGPDPSPDGALLLFQRLTLEKNPRDNYILDLASMQTRRVLPDGNDLSWSPDGKWIVYATVTGLGSFDLAYVFKMDVATSRTVRLSDTPEETGWPDIHPIWSPGGARIAFGSYRDDASEVYLMDADGSNLFRVPPPQEPRCGAVLTKYSPLAWSPDGSALIIGSWCQPGMLLRVVSSTGVELADWADLPHRPYALDWSPDGRRIVFDQIKNAQQVIYTANVDGSDAQKIGWNAFGSRWSPDGREIAYIGRDAQGLDQIYVINADGSGSRQLTNNPGAGRICLH